MLSSRAHQLPAAAAAAAAAGSACSDHGQPLLHTRIQVSAIDTIRYEMLF